MDVLVESLAAAAVAPGEAVNLDELRQLVDRKTETVNTLEALLEKEEAELVELERRLEPLEDERKRKRGHHERKRGHH